MIELATILVSEVEARVVDLKPIPTKIAGGTVRIIYDDPMWDKLTKNAVFVGSKAVTVLDIGNVVEIPAEAVAHPGKMLKIGICGTTADGKAIIPTVYANLGQVRPAADPDADPSTDSGLPVWAQLQAEIEHLKQGGPGGGSVGDEVLCVTIEGNESDGYTTNTAFAEIHNAFQADKAVHCRLENLDVSISLPLTFASDGIAVFSGSTVTGQMEIKIVGSKVAEVIGKTVLTEDRLPEFEAWAENLIDEKLEGFDPGSGGNVDLDTTLTEAGKAADAKATGDAIDGLSDKIGEYSGTANVLFDIVRRMSLDGTTGMPVVTEENMRAAIPYLVSLKQGSVVSMAGSRYSFGFNIFVNDALVQKGDWSGGSMVIEQDCQIAFNFKKYDNSAFSDADIDGLYSDFTIVGHGISMAESLDETRDKLSDLSGAIGTSERIHEALVKNKWSYGNVTASPYIELSVNIPAGTYMMSGVAVSTDTDGDKCSINFLYDDGSYAAYHQASRNGRFTFRLVANRTITKVRFYAAAAGSHAGDKATFTDIQLESGLEATEYVEYGANVEDFVSDAQKAIRQSEIAVGLFNPFNQPIYHHMNQEVTNAGIPAQSLYDVHYAKSLGFNMIEVNEQLCSDGVYVCKHGHQGKLGVGIKASDGNDYSQTAFSSVTSAWLRENIRYDSTIEKYCGYIPTLDEFCKECKKLNMAIKIATHGALDVVRKYMPDNMIWMTNNQRRDFNGTIEYIWDTSEAVDNCIAACKLLGAPLNIVVKAGQFDGASNALIAELCTKAHQNGFTVGTVYPNANSLQRARELGVDVSGSTGNDVNLLSIGNALNVSALDSAEFALDNATYDADTDTIVMAQNGTITIAAEAVKKGIASLRIRYNGTLTIGDGVTVYKLTEYASDGQKEVQMSIALQPYGGRTYTKWLVITADAETTIYDIELHCSKL